MVGSTNTYVSTVPLSVPSPSHQMRDPQMWPISANSPVPEISFEEDRLLEIARPISAFDTVDTAIGKEVSEDHLQLVLRLYDGYVPVRTHDHVRAFCRDIHIQTRS